jgi:CheY-like chemotaxis protein
VTGQSATASILTVENDEIVRADLRLVLEEAGFEVCADAHDGEEAVELARRHRPDLVLVDLGLPRVDGVETIRLIRDDRDVPVVALTGHRAGEVVERALEAGASAHVLKPFRRATLVGAVTRALADHRARRGGTEREHRHHLVMIDAMLRGGLSQREIERALRRANAWGGEAVGEGPVLRLRRFLGRRFAGGRGA